MAFGRPVSENEKYIRPVYVIAFILLSGNSYKTEAYSRNNRLSWRSIFQAFEVCIERIRNEVIIDSEADKLLIGKRYLTCWRLIKRLHISSSLFIFFAAPTPDSRDVTGKMAVADKRMHLSKSGNCHFQMINPVVFNKR